MYLILNAGSSSLKFKLFDEALVEKAAGIVERIGLPKPFLRLGVGAREHIQDFTTVRDHSKALALAFDALKAMEIDVRKVRAFGHRVVHGGETFTDPTVLTAASLKKLRAFNQLAPLHNPVNLAGIDSCRKLFPKTPNVAVFDTAFYRTIPDYAFMYALPYEYYKKHKIRKYGFHGISHEYVAHEAAAQLGRPLESLRLITCHLGSGSSVTAIKDGKAFDTSMGFTPLEGLTMSTRCGDIDAAIPLYLIRELKLKPAQVDDILNKHSGLLGISGYKDLRDVLVAAGIGQLPAKGHVSEEQKRRARLAFDMFCYDVARYIGQFASLMGGADAIVFTAGVGERSDVTRDRILEMVSVGGSPKTLVIPTNEELMIAREVKRATGK